MKKQRKILLQCILFFMVLLTSVQVFAVDLSENFVETKLSDEFLQYLELDDAEKSKVIMPRTYEVPKITTTITNPLRILRLLGSNSTDKYTLQEVIPANMVIKNQFQTNSCWTFSMLAALESNLALKDWKNGVSKEDAIVYDFSERHMEYATSRTFKDGEINPNGFYREVGSLGNYNLSLPYLINGTGAIAEEDMPFENNQNKIYIEEIQGKDVITQVNDTIIFPSYKFTDDKTEIITKMKEHIKNYGSIDACIHSSSIASSNSLVYNASTGALYCYSSNYKPDHAIAIVGWDDTYGVENFKTQPNNPGAWIIKNSWGTESGNAGFIYVSYEDANIYLQMSGIVDAQTEVEYENLYQYDQYGGNLYFDVEAPKAYIATIFERKSSGPEYLTQISINAPEPYNCKVYVNPNGTTMTKESLGEPVQLETGEIESIAQGYHTIDFKEPIQITGSSFVVMVEVQGIREDLIGTMLEINPKTSYGKSTIWNNVTTQSGKCFVSFDENLTTSGWIDTSNIYSETEGAVPNGDTTIKAFTTSKVLTSISVTNEPKTIYIKGQDFDKSEMVVEANYSNGESEVITDYTIIDGDDLELLQTSVTIEYKGKTTTIPIEVIEDYIESISVKTAPKIEYWAGENFDATGLVLEATYKSGKIEEISTGYEILDGENLKNKQTAVNIKYGEKTISLLITIKKNLVTKIEIAKQPGKVDYVVGQNFVKDEMIVIATYEYGSEQIVTDYEIENGTNLQLSQTSVTIKYENQIAIQKISVVEKIITSIEMKEEPEKLVYIQNKEELNLDGGVIEVFYNDNTSEEISMKSDLINVNGFDNKEIGIKTLILTYQDKTIQFEVTIKEDEKPINSNFVGIQGNIVGMQLYDTHSIIKVEVNNIVKATENEKTEYYYYISSNSNETNITEWVQIGQTQSLDNKLIFEINTSDISNIDKIVQSENLYIYIKEVATRNNMVAEKVTASLLLDATNVEVINSTSASKDNTLAQGIIPNAGKNILVIVLIFVVLVMSWISYLRYKDIQIK